MAQLFLKCVVRCMCEEEPKRGSAPPQRVQLPRARLVLSPQGTRNVAARLACGGTLPLAGT